jgi:hypothetical protein
VLSFLTKAGAELPEKWEASEINSVQAKFPMLTPKGWSDAQIGAAQGLRIVKAALQLDVDQFHQTGAHNPARIKAWLTKMSDKYDHWLTDIHTWSVASR